MAKGSWGLSPIERRTFPGRLTSTVGGGGTITLVTPAKITLAPLPGQAGGIRRTTASFTTLTLRFVADHPVPEPSAWLLLGVALLPLAYWRAG